MKIENNSIIDLVCVGRIDFGCPFIYKGTYYMKTNTSEGNMILCVSLDKGIMIPFNSVDRVTTVKAKVVIE